LSNVDEFFDMKKGRAHGMIYMSIKLLGTGNGTTLFDNVLVFFFVSEEGFFYSILGFLSIFCVPGPRFPCREAQEAF
jgi:hypothetical protein